MIVDKIRNATTRESAVVYEVTLRVWASEVVDGREFKDELATLVTRAIKGIRQYGD